MQDEIEVKARELLANAPVTRFIGQDFVPKEAAVRAIAAALRHRPVVDDARMARALEWVLAECVVYSNPEARTHLPAIEEAIAAYDPNCGGRTVRVVDDAMVERAECALGRIATIGMTENEYQRVALSYFDGDIDRALLAAYQQDNGGQQG